MSVNIIIPVAGKGTRFVDAGYDLPKPLIEVDGMTLMEHSISTLGIDGHFVFITRTFDNPDHNKMLTEIFEKVCKSFTEVRVDDKHLGAAHSALFAEKYIDADKELIVTNCDQHLDWDGQEFLRVVREQEADGAVVTYESTDLKNSFVISENFLVKAIAEKKQISNEALIGVHYWKKGKDFFDTARKFLGDYQKKGYVEAYVAPTYEYLLEDKKILSYKLHPNQYLPLGTPADVDSYLLIGEWVASHSARIEYDAHVDEIFGSVLEHRLGQINCANLKNVKLTNKNSGARGNFVVKSKAFIFDVGCTSYFHGLVDVLGQYYLLKQIYPDMVAIAFADHTDRLGFKEFMETISAEFGDIIYFDHNVKSIIIKELYLLSPLGFPWLLKTFKKYNRKIYDITLSNNINNDVYLKSLLSASRHAILSRMFDPHSQIYKDTDTSPKLFLHSTHKRLYDNPRSTDAEVEQYEKQIAEMKATNRYLKKSEYLKIVNYFKSIGYEEFDPADHTMSVQIAKISNAKAIATIAGSNSVHAIYTGNSSRFIVINPFLKYDFPHDKIVSLASNNAVLIENSDSESIENFLNKIKNIVEQDGEQSEKV